MESEFKLYLFPSDPDYQGDPTAIITQLITLKLAGTVLSNNRYATGDNFLNLLTFMGCSPNIELEPQDNKPFCYITVASQNQPQFITGTNTKYPACPQCKAKLKSLECAHCDNTLDPLKPNWRKSAFVASTWIIIANIYELEAIPNDNLLNEVEKSTGVAWKYAYIRQPLKVD